MISRFKKKKLADGEVSVSKNRNRKIEVDGVVYDSKVEYEYYLFLKLDPSIKSIKRCRSFKLIDSFTDHVNGVKYRQAAYKADFEVERDDKIEIHEVKNSYNIKHDQAYKLRVKLFRSRYPEFVFKQIIKKNKQFVEV